MFGSFNNVLQKWLLFDRPFTVWQLVRCSKCRNKIYFALSTGAIILIIYFCCNLERDGLVSMLEKENPRLLLSHICTVVVCRLNLVICLIFRWISTSELLRRYTCWRIDLFWAQYHLVGISLTVWFYGPVSRTRSNHTCSMTAVASSQGDIPVTQIWSSRNSGLIETCIHPYSHLLFWVLKCVRMQYTIRNQMVHSK